MLDLYSRVHLNFEMVVRLHYSYTPVPISSATFRFLGLVVCVFLWAKKQMKHRFCKLVVGSVKPSEVADEKFSREYFLAASRRLRGYVYVVRKVVNCQPFLF